MLLPITQGTACAEVMDFHLCGDQDEVVSQTGMIDVGVPTFNCNIGSHRRNDMDAPFESIIERESVSQDQHDSRQDLGDINVRDR